MKTRFLSVFRCWLVIILSFTSFAIFSYQVQADTSTLPGKPGNPLLSGQPEFLPVDQAFQVSAVRQADGSLELNWIIAKDYYLYRHRFQFESIKPGALSLSPRIPAGIAKHDEYFGDVEVYYNNVTISLTDREQARLLRIGYQGCAEAGLCYPPQTRFLEIEDTGINLSADLPGSSESNTSLTEEQEFFQLLTSESLLNIAAVFLIAGLALTFTPCVLPMVPIISGLIVGQNPKPTRQRAFALSLTYVLAMAVTYAIAGTLTGYFGAELNLQMKLQSPTVLITIALLFVLFSLAMFGLFDIRLPSSIQTGIHQLSAQQRGGSFIGVAVIGMLSTLIVSPCVSAPLAGALVYISSTADPLLGGLALLALGLGMGIPLLLIGTFGAQLMPKTGTWMNQVKVFFGVLLLAVSIWMVERVIPEQITLALIVLLLLGYTGYLLKPLRFPFDRGDYARLFASSAMLVYSSLLSLGAINNQFNPLTPLDNLNAEKQAASHAIMTRFISVNTVDELEKQLEEAAQPVMLDIYADWCISCKILENEVFPHPQVSEQLENFTLLRADITKNSKQQQQFLKYFDLFGPPGLLFFNDGAKEMRGYRVQGEMTATRLSHHLAQILNAGQ